MYTWWTTVQQCSSSKRWRGYSMVACVDNSYALMHSAWREREKKTQQQQRYACLFPLRTEKHINIDIAYSVDRNATRCDFNREKWKQLSVCTFAFKHWFLFSLALTLFPHTEKREKKNRSKAADLFLYSWNNHRISRATPTRASRISLPPSLLSLSHK